MNLVTGINYLTIGGARRPAKFGTNQTAIFCQTRKIDLGQYNQDWHKIITGTGDGSEVRDLLFSALAAGCISAKIPCDFTSEEVGDWIDSADAGEVKRFFDLLAAQINPNGQGAKPNTTTTEAQAA